MSDEISQQSVADDDGFVDSNRITLTFKPSWVYVILAVGMFVAGLGVGYTTRGRQSATAQGAAAADSVPQENPASAGQASQQQSAQGSGDIPRYDVPTDDDPALGEADAPVTIIEFSDFECPYCTRFHLETFDRLMGTYGDQIQFVYRDFPLVSIHPEAFPAAEAANCAGDQGKYWEYHDKLFDGGPQALGQEAYYRYAEEIGLDVNAFDECLTTHKYQDEVQADYDYAVNLGIRSTPTFFINGIPVVGAQPFEVFQQVIDAELEK